MYPFLRSGDSLRVLRCEATSLRRGDIGIALRPEGVLVAHLVDSVDPIVLTSSFGTADPPGTRVLGKAVAVRTRAGLDLPLGSVSRAALLAGSRALRWAVGNAPARFVLRNARHALGDVRARADALRFGAPIVRRLLESEIDSAYLFVEDRLSLDFEVFSEAVRASRVVGAFVGGSLRALCVSTPKGELVIVDRGPAGERYARLVREYRG